MGADTEAEPRGKMLNFKDGAGERRAPFWEVQKKNRKNEKKTEKKTGKQH